MVECSPATRAARVRFPDDANSFWVPTRSSLPHTLPSPTLVRYWWVKAQISRKSKKVLETRGIDPRTSHMLSERSTIWATAPVTIRANYNIMGYVQQGYFRVHFAFAFCSFRCFTTLYFRERKLQDTVTLLTLYFREFITTNCLRDSWNQNVRENNLLHRNYMVKTTWMNSGYGQFGCL